MPNSAGDIVTVLSLEDFEFRTGLRDSASEVKKFSTDAGSAGKGAAAGFGRAVGQMGFAMQDFSSVLAMGGKNALGRALMSTMNNVQMLGAAFGPWGIAATAAAGAIGSMLLPKLLEGGTAFEAIAEETKNATAALDGYIKRGGEMIDFRGKLGKMVERDQIRDTRKALKEELEKNKLGQDALMGGAKMIGGRLQAMKNNRAAAGLDPHGGIMDKVMHPAAFIGNMIEGTDAAIEGLDKQREDLFVKLRERANEHAHIEAKIAELDKHEAVAGGNDVGGGALDVKGKIERTKLAAEVYEKRQALARQLKHEVARPFDLAQEEIRRLAQARQEGVLSDDDFAKGSNKAIRTFRQAEVQDHRNAGVAAGSSQAYEAIRDSIRAANRQDDEQVKLLKQQVEEAKKTSKNTERLIDNLKIEAVNIA